MGGYHQYQYEVRKYNYPLIFFLEIYANDNVHVFNDDSFACRIFQFAYGPGHESKLQTERDLQGLRNIQRIISGMYGQQYAA